MRNSAEEMIETLRAAGQEFSEEEQADIELYTKGRALAQMVGFEGWQVVLEMLSAYVLGAARALIDIPPGDERVSTAHAAASALDDLYHKFLQDIQNAVNHSSQPPDALKRKIRSAMPVESM